MKKLFVAALLSLAGFAANAAPERTLSLSEVSLEDIKIEGRIQTWTLRKVCVDGQAYLLILGVSGPNGISPSFKDGKPEQCQAQKTK